MEKVIFDCDNTFGVKEKDVDDGLTLLYLLGSEAIDLLGVTTTFGNSDIETVHKATINMFKELNLHLPLHKGSGKGDDPISDASRFLAETVSKYPNEIKILATGSLSNLYGAYMLDNDFFRKAKEIVLMGGITEPLVINGKVLNELNFSSDPIAAYNVLSSYTEVTVLTGHICLQALFGEKEYDRLIKSDKSIYKYIKDKTVPWFEYIMNRFGIKEFYNWDIVAAMYITNKELFKDRHIKVSSSIDDLKTGLLKIDDKGYTINIPTKILDIVKFNDIIFDTWGKVEI